MRKKTSKGKSKKVNIKRVIFFLTITSFLAFFTYMLLLSPIKNVYITGNTNLSDKEIMQTARILDYPSFLLTFSYKIKQRLLTNPYIKDVKIEKRIGNKLYIKVTENKPICIDSDNELILANGKKIVNNKNLNYPMLKNDISTIYKAFIKNFSLVKDSILVKISEIEYSPTNVDKERFILYMSDGNIVYITLPKIEKINKYDGIYQQLDGNKGVVYLDSGDYIEIKDKVGDSTDANNHGSNTNATTTNGGNNPDEANNPEDNEDLNDLEDVER